MKLFDSAVSVLAYMLRNKRLPKLIKPITLTDKILAIKLNQTCELVELRKLAADRLNVRNYVNKKSSACSLIPLLWEGDKLTKNVWDSLPSRFVIKANHGSKMVKIINKDTDCYESILELTCIWLKNNYYKKGREWVYKDTPRKLLVEELLELSSKVPPDFKFFCLNGKVAFIQVDLDRFDGHRRNIYDNNFKLIDIEYHFPKGYALEKPKLFDKALNIAEDLSIDFDFIRVDLYLLEDKVYFGELTNFPGNCLESFSDHTFDRDMGERLVVNNA